MAVSEPSSEPYYGPVPASRERAYADARNRMANSFQVTGSVVGGVKVWSLGDISMEHSGAARLESVGAKWER